MNKITKLKINLFADEKGESLEKEYEREKKKYIANFTEYVPGGLFRSGYDKHNPQAGEAKWNSSYINGYYSWADSKMRLTSTGYQMIIDKINELIDIINSKNETKKPSRKKS